MNQINSKPTVLIPCPNGADDSEFACIYEILFREGADITITKVNELENMLNYLLHQNII